MWKRAALLSLALGALLAAPVSAQEEGTDSASPTATAVGSGDSIQVTGEGCPPDAAVDYSWVFGIYGTRSAPPPVHRDSTTADASGSFSFTLTDLSDEGSWSITVECGGGRTELAVDLAAADTTPTTMASPTATAVGGEDFIEVTGEGCPPGDVVDYSWFHGPYGTRSAPPPVRHGSTTADASGNFSFTITEVPDGPYWSVHIECGGGRIELSVELAAATTAMTTATPELGGGTVPSALPRTGNDGTTRLAWIGAAALAMGGLATHAAKRQKAKAAH